MSVVSMFVSIIHHLMNICLFLIKGLYNYHKITIMYYSLIMFLFNLLFLLYICYKYMLQEYYSLIIIYFN